MKVLITLVALLATTQTFADEVWPGGIPPYDQCFPNVNIEYFYTNGVFGSLGLALENQDKCRAERFKIAGY